MNKGLIGNIGRYALHDGPGIRTTIFFKGCPLKCPWCHNPEFINSKPEIISYQERCIGCGDCVAGCPEDGISSPGGPNCLNRSFCNGCGQCAAVCPAKAFRQVGQWYTAEELMRIILRDRLFYETSGGGVTLSGGEPMQQITFVGQLLQLLKEHGLHTVLQTCGLFSWEIFAERILDQIDLIFFDLKIAERSEHKKNLGRDNDVIMANLRKLVMTKPEVVVVRIPLIPGYTATRENVSSLSGVLRDIGARRLELVPYHPWGNSKSANMNKKFDEKLPNVPMAQSDVARWRRFFPGMEITGH